MARDPVALDIARLTPPSALLAERLFARRPDVERHAIMEHTADTDAFDLALEIPSPTGDDSRQVIVWMDEGRIPSVSFGHWHTHVGDELADPTYTEAIDEIVDMVAAILADELVLIYDIGRDDPGSCEVIDLRCPVALMDELTSTWSPGRVRMKTFSGAGDRELGLEDFLSD